MVPQPEQQARIGIDKLLAQAGWLVCDADKANIHGARGVAIREFPFKTGHGFAGRSSSEVWMRSAEVRPVERVRHGRRTLGFRVEQGARAKKHAHAPMLGRIAA